MSYVELDVRLLHPLQGSYGVLLCGIAKCGCTCLAPAGSYASRRHVHRAVDIT